MGKPHHPNGRLTSKNKMSKDDVTAGRVSEMRGRSGTEMDL